jgi:hypothetical protein
MAGPARFGETFRKQLAVFVELFDFETSAPHLGSAGFYFHLKDCRSSGVSRGKILVIDGFTSAEADGVDAQIFSGAVDFDAFLVKTLLLRIFEDAGNEIVCAVGAAGLFGGV